MDNWKPAARLIGIGFYIVACIFGGVFGGLKLDQLFHTAPILLLVGLVVGLVAAFWGVYQMIKPYFDDNKRGRG